MFQLLVSPVPVFQVDERRPHPHGTRALRFAYERLLTPQLRRHTSQWSTLLDAALPDLRLLVLKEVGLLRGAWRMECVFDRPTLPGK